MCLLIWLNLESGIVKESPKGHPPIHLPSIIALEIDICSSHVDKGVLSVLDLPSVETLTIHGQITSLKPLPTTLTFITACSH